MCARNQAGEQGSRMEKRAKHTQQRAYDLSFPYRQEGIDEDDYLMTIEPWELEEVFGSICKRFVFYIQPGPLNDHEGCGTFVTYKARIHFNDKKTPSSASAALMEACKNLHELKVTPTSPGHRDADGFYRFVGEKVINLFGPMWMDTKKMRADYEKAKKEEQRASKKEEKRAGKEEEQRVSKKAKRVADLPDEPIEARTSGRWVSMLVLEVDIQGQFDIDVLIMEHKRRGKRHSPFVEAMMSTGGQPIPAGMIHPAPIREHLQRCSQEANHAMLQMIDLTLLDHLGALRKEEVDIPGLWDVIVELKRCDGWGWKKGINVRVVVMAYAPPADESKYRFIKFRCWRVAEKGNCIEEVE